MKLRIAYRKDEYERCYYETLIYRIKKYQALDESEQIKLADKLDFALNLMSKEASKIYQTESLESLYESLQIRKEHTNQIQRTNEGLVKVYACIIENLFLNNIPENADEYFKIMYLTHYLLSNVTYSQQYYNYCINNLPGDGFDFDFKDGVPADKTIEGMLAIGQGGSYDISNIAYHLGQGLGLNIEKIFTNYHGYSHALNAVTLIGGKSSYIDFTNIIRNNEKMYNYFLVSEKDLNEYSDYEVEDGYDNVFKTCNDTSLKSTKTIPRGDVDYYYRHVMRSYVNQLNQEIDNLKMEYIPKSRGKIKR